MGDSRGVRTCVRAARLVRPFGFADRHTGYGHRSRYHDGSRPRRRRLLRIHSFPRLAGTRYWLSRRKTGGACDARPRGHNPCDSRHFARSILRFEHHCLFCPLWRAAELWWRHGLAGSLPDHHQYVVHPQTRHGHVSHDGYMQLPRLCHSHHHQCGYPGNGLLVKRLLSHFHCGGARHRRNGCLHSQ